MKSIKQLLYLRLQIEFELVRCPCHGLQTDLHASSAGFTVAEIKLNQIVCSTLNVFFVLSRAKYSTTKHKAGSFSNISTTGTRSSILKFF